MAKFRYVALDAKGRETQDVVEAENEAKAVALIRSRGLFPTTISEVGVRRSTATAKPATPVAARKGRGLQTEIRLPRFLTEFMQGRVKPKQLMVYTRQLATLVNAGLPLLRGLHILQRQEKHPGFRAAINGMAEAVESGSTFAEAAAQYPRIFSTFFVNMVRAGEASGALDTVLLRLAEYMEKSQRIRNKVKSAMVYPIVVLVMAVTILTVMMVFVIPKFREIFDDLLGNEPLPALTQAVINTSLLVAHHGGYVVAAVVVLVLLVRLLARTKPGRRIVDAAKLRAPIFGDLLRKSAIANFTRTLGTLLTGGVPILTALNIVRDITGNAVLSRAIQQVHDSVKEGESMVTPLEASGVFPDMVISMIQVGEETGALPDMLMKIAETYDNEVDSAVEALTSIIEPILIILLALIVGTIVIAMFLPMVRIIGKIA